MCYELDEKDFRFNYSEHFDLYNNLEHQNSEIGQNYIELCESKGRFIDYLNEQFNDREIEKF